MIKCNECNKGNIQMVGLIPVGYELILVDGEIEYGDREELDGINDVEYLCNHCGRYYNYEELVD